MSGEGFNVEAMMGFLDKAVRAVGNARRRSRNLQRKLEQYDDIKESLAELIANKFDIKCEIWFYGSRVIGIGNYKSDIDIYVELNEDYYRGTNIGVQRQIMAYISSVFRRGGSDFDLQKIPLYKATVPLIFCFYRPKRLRTELTFNDGIGVENSALLRHFFEIQPEAVNLFHFLRIWLAIAELRFKNYQILMLMVYFLQSGRFLPPLGRVQPGLRPRRIKGWNIAFSPARTLRHYACHEMKFFLNYAVDLFRFYGNFNFERRVIIPYMGESVLRENYATCIRGSPGNPGLFKIDKPMAVTSLFTNDYNVTYDIGIDRVRKFTRLCRYSAGLLENN